MTRRTLLRWALRGVVAAQLLGSDLLDLAADVLPEEVPEWFVDFEGVRFYPHSARVPAVLHENEAGEWEDNNAWYLSGGGRITVLADGWYRLEVEDGALTHHVTVRESAMLGRYDSQYVRGHALVD